MRAVGFRRQGITFSMLLCDIASLSRLSITIVSLTGLPTPQKLNQFVRSRFDGSHYTTGGDN